MTVLVRKFRPGEEMQLWNLFFSTVRNVNSADYTAEQLRAWAPENVDDQKWRDRIKAINPYVCVFDGNIVGYADLQSSGYVDHFFVHHQWQGRGIGKLLFATIESEARVREYSELSADVSITARPFFESRGFCVVSSQEVTRGAITLRNFKMMKSLRY